MLAQYACITTVGRVHDEPADVRHPFERDRDRIIHSVAFRRLQYKTQVFVNHEGDHYRTRLTHTLEVSQISRSIARRLRLNEDLTELVALAHDLGHPPFGHAGEDGLSVAAAAHGGFDHNAQALRIMCNLEERYEHFNGLNLCTESIDGIIKHNGPVDLNTYKSSNAQKTIQDVASLYNICLDTQPTLEAQVAALADDIAYCNHDIDDGIRAGLIKLQDLRHIYLLDKLYDSINTGSDRVTSIFVRKLMTMMIMDLLEVSQNNLTHHSIDSLSKVVGFERGLIELSAPIERMKQELKAFLFENMYRHERVNKMTDNAKNIVFKLFNAFMSNEISLPTEWQHKIVQDNKALVVLDYIAGMTDRYAMLEYHKLKST